jgi:hypothetical protein
MWVFWIACWASGDWLKFVHLFAFPLQQIYARMAAILEGISDDFLALKFNE